MAQEYVERRRILDAIAAEQSSCRLRDGSPKNSDSVWQRQLKQSNGIESLIQRTGAIEAVMQGSRQQQNTEGSEETRDNNTYSNSSSSSSSSGIGGEGNSSASVRNVPQDGLRNVPQDGPSLSAPYVSHGLKQQQQVAEPTRKALESSDISNSSVTSSSDVNRNSSTAGVRTPNSAFIDNSRKELRLLRRTWLEKMLSAEREMARKNVKSSSSAKLNSGKIKVRKQLKRTGRK